MKGFSRRITWADALRYETVYDVLKDCYHWRNEWLGIPVGVAIFVLSMRQLRRREWQMTGYPAPYGGNPWIGFVVGGVLGIVSASITYGNIGEQYRCKHWAQSGEYQTVQGAVSGWRRFKGSNEFTVAGVRFVYRPDSAGFRGEFTTPSVPRKPLRDDQVVRIAYREGYILRIEIASP